MIINFVKNLFKTKKTNQLETRLKQLESSMNTLSAVNNNLKIENEQLENDMVTFKKLAQEKKTKYDSKEPWIEITSEEFDERKGIRIGLDWNDAFIQYLKDGGVQGATDEEIIRKYLAYLYEDIATRLDDESLDVRERKGKISDFQ